MPSGFKVGLVRGTHVGQTTPHLLFRMGSGMGKSQDEEARPPSSSGCWGFFKVMRPSLILKPLCYLFTHILNLLNINSFPDMLWRNDPHPMQSSEGELPCIKTLHALPQSWREISLAALLIKYPSYHSFLPVLPQYLLHVLWMHLPSGI